MGTHFPFEPFQLTAPLREPTIVLAIGRVVSVFQLTAPLREPTLFLRTLYRIHAVSTHGSLAGADENRRQRHEWLCRFNSRLPCGSRQGYRRHSIGP